MCGIIGFYSPAPTAEHLQDLGLLFAQSKVRGTHSFGLSYPIEGEDDKTMTIRTHHLEEIIYALSCLESEPPTALIGHNRYSTSGDWKDHKNNQPLFTEDFKIAFAFNGVIDMRSKAQWEEEYQKKFRTDNDAEIFLNWIAEDKDPVEFIKQKPCSFAGLYLKSGQAFALRNKNRPMWLLRSQGAIFIASTRDIFLRTFGKVQPIELPTMELFRVQDLLL